MTTREPLFTERDVAELTALVAYRDSLCPHCRRPVDLCKAASEQSGAGFVVERRLCHAQHALVETQQAVHSNDTDGGKKPPPPAASARVWSLAVHPARR